MMKPTLILIRGNSGSGKTALADKLQGQLGYERSLLLHEDILRRQILHENKNPAAPITELIRLMVNLGERNYQVTILEGILSKERYGEALEEMIRQFAGRTLAYYLAVPFERTVLNNARKKVPFSQQLLKQWWRANDYLDIHERRLMNNDLVESVARILADIGQEGLGGPSS